MKAVFCIFLVCPMVVAAEMPDAAEAAYPALERFVQVMETVRKRHPDMDRLAYDRLVNHALDGMLSSLDPHSSFIHPEMNAQLAEGVNPEIASLGLSLEWVENTARISAVAPNGAAVDGGMPVGARLLEVDARSLEGIAFADLLAALRRPPGDVSRIRFLAANERESKEVKLTHRLIQVRSVAESKIMKDKIGYIRLAEFGSGCAREMETALDDLENEGMTSLVLDLRGNGGGDLHETVKILGLFLTPDMEVVTIRGREEAENESLKTPSRQRRKRDYPLVVLQDRGSASASELTAGALRDTKRAKVVGELSYGKGSVQNIVPTGGGTALRLTVATYHTPSGDTPHRKGITPDISVEMDDEMREKMAKVRRLDTLPPEERAALEKWQDPVIEAALTAIADKN